VNVALFCPGPTFSNFMAVAATEKAGEVIIKMINNSRSIPYFLMFRISEDLKLLRIVA